MGSLDPDVDMKLEFDDSGYVPDETGSKPAMEEYRGSVNLLDLSDDVLLYILRHLSAHDLKSLGYACARLGALILDHTLWVDVDGGDVPHGRKRVRWLLMRVLGPQTRSLRLTGYAEQVSGCLGFVSRCDNSEEEATAEKERCESRLPFWLRAVSPIRPPLRLPARPPPQAARLAPEEPVAGPLQAPVEPMAGPSHPPVEPMAGPSEPSNEPSTSANSAAGPSQQNVSQCLASSALPQTGSSQALADSPSAMSVSEPSTSEPMSSTSQPMPSTSDPMPSTSDPMSSTSQPMQSTSDPKPSTSDSMPSRPETTQALPSPPTMAGPSTSANISQPPVSGSQPSTAPSAPGPNASPSGPQLPNAGVPAAGPSVQLFDPPQAPSILAPRLPIPRSYPTSPTCPGPQPTLTHTALRALSALCPNLTVLELDYCVIDCQTTNIGQFPKTLQRLSLKGTKCFNTEAKSFIFKIQDYLPNLEDIELSYCSWVEPACILPLSKVPNLIKLTMRECHKLSEFVAYASLATRYGFKKLRFLDLRGTPVGDSEVSALGWLVALEELYLSPSPKTPTPAEHAHNKQDPLPEFKELADWEEIDPEYFRISEMQEAEWTHDENSPGNVNKLYNFDESSAEALRNMVAQLCDSNPPGTHAVIRRAHQQVLEVARRMRLRQPGQQPDRRPDHQPNQQPGPSSGTDKPGTSGQKRKSEKNDDSSSDDDQAPSKAAATTRTVATQTGSRSKSKGSKHPKKTKSTNTPRRVFEITINETISHAEILQANNNEAAANNNNREDNNQVPVPPYIEQSMDVDHENDNQNVKNEDTAGPSNVQPVKSSENAERERNHKGQEVPGAGNQAESAQTVSENIAEAEIPKHGNTKSTEEKGNKEPMDVDQNPIIEEHAGPSNNDPSNNISVFTMQNRNVLYFTHCYDRNPEDRPEAENQDESAHINTENITEAGTLKDETHNSNNQAEENLAAATDAEENKEFKDNENHEPENATNETEEKKTKDAGNQTRNQYNGVPRREEGPQEQAERNRNPNENRARNFVVDESVHLANIEQMVNNGLHHAARDMMDAFERDLIQARPERLQRLYQFRQYRRPIVIEEFINNLYNEPRNQRPMPRGVIFAGLIPARLDHSSLVSDSSIRRFGRAVGENIVYLGGGPLAGVSNARPDRSNLRILSVTGFRHVTDSSLTHLASAAPQLHTLNVTGTGVSARASKAFRALRPDVNLITDLPEEESED